jgi:hypothetical protein
VREGDRHSSGGAAVIEPQSMVSDGPPREAPDGPSLERADGTRGWNPFILSLAVLTAASWALLLILESQLTFFADEWKFILDRRDWSVGDFLDPHNDHIALAPVAIYKLLLSTFGMERAFPFQVTSTLVLVLSAVLLFVYLRRRVGDWIAVLGCALILFLGAAYIDLLWPFQIGFTGSVAAGLGALLALDRDDRTGDRIACALLVLSTSFSEVGVPFVAGALVNVLVGERSRIRRLYVAFVPLVLYAIWWLGWGHEATGTFSVDNVLESPKFAFDAASQAAASLLGLGTPLHASEHDPPASWRDPVGLNWGRVLLVVGIGLAVWRFRRLGGIPRSFWVALAIGASFWFLTAFNAFPPFRTPTTIRYQYPGAVFLLLIAAEVLRGVRLNRRALALGSAVTVLAVLSGLWFVQLGYSKRQKPLSDRLRGSLTAIEIARDRVQPEFGIFSGGFSPIIARSYLSAAGAYGSPAYSEPELASSPATARFAADNTLVGALGIELASEQAPPSRGQEGRATRCRTVTATPAGQTGLAFGPGEITLRPRPGTSAEVLLGRFADGFPVPLGRLRPGHASSVALPADRSPRPWRLGLRGEGRVTVCGARASTTTGGGATPTTPATTNGGGAQPVSAGVFVGKVDGTDAEVALVTNGERLSGAYLCSPNGAVWFRPATFAGGTADLVPRSGETLGEASFAGEGASGNVDLGGDSHSFSAELATGKAGLYRTTSGEPEGEGRVSETGWIVLPDGSKCGRTNSITPGGDFKTEPAPSRPKGHVTDFTNPFPF